ncbi:hypothetical protein P154DRAFT_339460 [Amniculicola lignicola CBS 123094]|uniref:Uncharacterized protein n=1 Tax=Amniculicola lignicola CBS 123094 TaxID=1392246 RepID=A0A6A5WV99_9PLEO|nr:hypothetical protein P154DRAFT_339460 [Amniculicola lignicola CBS 123094]
MARGGGLSTNERTKATATSGRFTTSNMRFSEYDAGNGTLATRNAYGDFDKDVMSRRGEEEEDNEVAPTPIAQIVQLGNGEQHFLPIPGFEHLLSEACLENLQLHILPRLQTKATPLSSRMYLGTGDLVLIYLIIVGVIYNQVASSSSRPTEQGAEKKTSSPSRSRGTKRSRSSAKLKTLEKQPAPPGRPLAKRIETKPTRTFFIADVDALKAYMFIRLKELRLKPLRKIVTEWINKADLFPNRRQWPYHHEIPSKTGNTKQPPEWTMYLSDVPYTEPAHLKEQSLIPLAIYILLAHQYPDQKGNRRINWVSKLEEKAKYACETLKDEEFFSGKPNPSYYRQMKVRATECILRDLFEQAKRYEDHVAQYQLYDGCESSDPESKKGIQVTWREIPLPTATGSRDTEGKAPPPPKRPRHVSERAAFDHGSGTEDGDSMYSGTSGSGTRAFSDVPELHSLEQQIDTVPNTPMLSPIKQDVEMERTLSSITNETLADSSPTFSHHSLPGHLSVNLPANLPTNVPVPQQHSDAMMNASTHNQYNNLPVPTQLTSMPPSPSTFYSNSFTSINPTPNTSFTSMDGSYTTEPLGDVKTETPSGIPPEPSYANQHFYGGPPYMTANPYRMEDQVFFGLPQFVPNQFAQASFNPATHSPPVFDTGYNGTGFLPEWPGRTQQYINHAPTAAVEEIKTEVMAGQNPFAPPPSEEGGYGRLGRMGAGLGPQNSVLHGLPH